MTDTRRADRPHRFRHEAMACTWEIQVCGQERDYAEQAARAAFDEVDRLEQELSRFVEHSDVSRINARPPGKPLLIGPDAGACLALALRVQGETDGAFDVTLGSGRRASAEARHDAPFLLDLPSRTVTKTTHATIDLGGVGKGYAVDQAVSVLREWSITAAIVHAGQSTLYALGTLARDEPWTVAIRDPREHSRKLGEVRLRDAALSGSGTLIHGQHIVDPRTGLPPANAALGTWSVAGSAALSDALSTAFMVMSAGAVAHYCRQHEGVAALLYTGTKPEPTLIQFGEELGFGSA